ncbi:MAG: response regulator [Anaerolineaceae bacterium]|nr:response regulator [Anaerolineaceae bacterium]
MAEKILIIDDDSETLRLIGLMLQRQGYQTVTASNGDEGVALAKHELPDLVILDIMMPDVDGFMVAKHLRAEPGISEIPILMFTAKSQVDDKVAGFEAGADDYLTKPVHPVELVAHVKALLSRRVTYQSEKPQQKKQGYTIGVIGAKGGLGTSTTALNLGIALSEKGNLDVVCAEILPGRGIWGLELGLAVTNGLDNILQSKPGDITNELIEQNLLKTLFGIRLLLSTSLFSSTPILENIKKLNLLIDGLNRLSKITILDFGVPSEEFLTEVIEKCDQIILVTESHPISIERTRSILEKLSDFGFGKHKLIHVIAFNRVRADIQLTQTQIQEKIGVLPLLAIPSAPELAYRAAIHFQPIIKAQTDSLMSQQFYRMAEQILVNIKQ